MPKDRSPRRFESSSRPSSSTAPASGLASTSLRPTTEPVESADAPDSPVPALDYYAFCALPTHFFDRSRSGEVSRGASLSVQSWAPTPKDR